MEKNKLRDKKDTQLETIHNQHRQLFLELIPRSVRLFVIWYMSYFRYIKLNIVSRVKTSNQIDISRVQTMKIMR